MCRHRQFLIIIIVWLLFFSVVAYYMWLCWHCPCVFWYVSVEESILKVVSIIGVLVLGENEILNILVYIPHSKLRRRLYWVHPKCYDILISTHGTQLHFWMICIGFRSWQIGFLIYLFNAFILIYYFNSIIFICYCFIFFPCDQQNEKWLDKLFH